MSFEELLQEHTKALRENTKALIEYTKALNSEHREIEVEHTKNSACKFCGITYKTMQMYLASGMITPVRRDKGRREYFKEKDLVTLCESVKLYSGDYGRMKSISGSRYYTI